MGGGGLISNHISVGLIQKKIHGLFNVIVLMSNAFSKNINYDEYL